ncbi:glycerol ethanol, ferric requiring protein [Coelomomyces lativittatus]|nr:glycerol ethanol, ferric requiring protein [Coelomomyces lativittatus]
MYGSQSGIAEVKTMLGGFRLHASVVSLKTGWMKWMGLVYAMASGLSIGNKAPLVHIAACWAQGWIHATQSLLRFKKRKNDPEVLHFITCACAAGMAAAFGSPIGGILFTLEEIATFFPIPVMWMAFMCCLCATLMLQILNPFNTGSMVAFQVTRPHEWHLFELMPFAFLGVIGGLTGALFVRWSIRIQLARRRSEFCLKHPILDATYLAFITSFFGYWSALTRDHILSLLAGLFKDCDPNQNYHGICNASPFMNIFSLVYAFLLQFGSSLLTYGAKVPSGIFLPCMAMGACLGRIVGILVSTFQMTFSTSPIFASCQLVDKDCVAPGSYALLGAAAALTGATKLTLSIVVILFELTGALHFVLPTIVVVVVAKFVSDALVGLEGYSTRMVQLNHYPYLETRESYHFTVCVDKIMTHQSLVVLKNGMTVHALRMILSTVSFNTFPIVNDLHSRGLEGCITRRELEEGLEQDVLNGSDIQGIQWHRFQLTRSSYRNARKRDCLFHRDTLHDLSVLEPQFSRLRSNAQFYRFHYTTFSERCSYFHFQLRNLIWAISNFDVFYSKVRYIMHWNSLRKSSHVLLDCFADPRVTPRGPVRLASMAATKDVVVAGGYQGEYILKPLDTRLPPVSGILTENPNSITNHIEVQPDRYGTLNAYISSNDSMVRQLHLHTSKVIQQFKLPWAVNCCTQSPDHRMLAAVGDGCETIILDAKRGDEIATLKGHLDYSFASAWSPDGLRLATGNQDKSVRIYDTRKFSSTLHVLPTQMGAVRSIRFSPTGVLMYAEDEEMVHVVDPSFQHQQTIDFVGDIAGVSFSPDGSHLFIGNADELYSSIIEFQQVDPSIGLEEKKQGVGW